MSVHGWSHEEAKRHTLLERLYERCSVYAQDYLACPDQGDLPHEDWCERCLAATRLVAAEATVERVRVVVGRLADDDLDYDTSYGASGQMRLLDDLIAALDPQEGS